MMDDFLHVGKLNFNMAWPNDWAVVFSDGDSSNPVFRGYAIKFGVLSAPMKGYRFLIPEDARIGTEQDVLALYNHDFSRVLGRKANGTLRLIRDSVGLAVEIQPPATEGRIVESVKRKDTSGMSFSGINWRREHKAGTNQVNINGFDLVEVSVTPTPAFSETEINAFGLEYATAFSLPDLDVGPPEVNQALAEMAAREQALRERQLVMRRSLLDD